VTGVAGGADEPLDAATFDDLMRPLGPFEPEPELALAVSGGRDSMALALLADDWARRRGGRAVALTVVHGLRPGAAGEARQVRDWLDARGIAQHTLEWRGPKPTSAVQAAARRARYRLLQAWCRRHGVLHLVLAHQREDQAETVLLRLGHGSGLDGLAAMPALRGQAGVRLLRPLLAVPRARLAATLLDRGQAWIDDPSNRDTAFERTRLGAALDRLDDVGIEPRRLVEAAIRVGRGRAALERETARLAAASVRPWPAGFCRLDPVPLRAAPADTSRALLRRLLMTVGGAEYPPAGASLERLSSVLRQDRLGRGRTLGGCRVAPWRGSLVVARESRNLPAGVAVRGAGRLHWDRFACALRGPAAAEAGPFTIAALGADGWRSLQAADVARPAGLPAFVAPTLPALWDRHGLLAAPHLSYRRDDAVKLEFSVIFQPLHSLAAVPFTVASGADETI
jgi:tRNA(Ile)-lysidine synthase